MKKNILILVIFAVIGIVVYWNSLDNTFFHDDDEEVIVYNQGIRKIGNIPLIFIDPGLSTSNPIHVGHYRPLVTVSYAIDYAIGGLNPVGYHLVNLFFHVGAAFLIFLIVKAMINPNPTPLVPLAAGLIFLLHPFNSEAVNYATARSSVMSGFFYLLAFYCWVKYRSQKSEVRQNHTSNFYLFSLLAFTAGMLSKEVVITLPIMLWLYDIYFTPTLTLPPQGGGENTAGLYNLPNYLTYIPFVVVIAAYMVIRHALFSGMVPSFQRDLWTQFLTELPVLAEHWVLFVWPKNLTLIHHVEIYRSMAWPVVISAVFFILYISVGVYLLFRGWLWGRLISFFMFWFFVVLLPTSIIPLNSIFQENRGYLAIVSFVVMLGVILGEVSRRLGRNNRVFYPVLGFVAILLVAYSVLTVKRNIVWGDRLIFWQDAMAKSPQSGTAYAGLAAIYRVKGDISQAIDIANKGLLVAPDNILIRINLARSYYLQGKTDKAIHYYTSAISGKLTPPFVWEELTFLLIKKGDFVSAERFLNQALKIWDDSPKLYCYMGLAQRGSGRMNDSVKSFRKALSLHPNYLLAAYRLADTLEKMGEPEEASKWYKEVVRISSRQQDLSDIPNTQDIKALKTRTQDAMQRVKEDGLSGGGR